MSSRRDWSDEENDLIVADYFAMFMEELAGRPFSKAEHRRALAPLLRNRSEGSIEFKHQNVSAVLQAIGSDWIRGYLPRGNVQLALADAVGRWLAANPAWLGRAPGLGLDRPGPDVMAARPHGTIPVERAPTLSNEPPPKEKETIRRLVRQFDAAGRDARNRELGEAGEAAVLEHERATLKAAGRHDLLGHVRWVSRDDGDGAGYDIASIEPDGRTRRLIEVKTTEGGERTPFHVTRNELDVSEARKSEWLLFRLWGFRREPRAFELRPPLERHVSLIATSYKAYFDGDGASSADGRTVP